VRKNQLFDSWGKPFQVVVYLEQIAHMLLHVGAWVSAWTRYAETPQFIQVAPACMQGTAKTGTALQADRAHPSSPAYKIFLTMNESLGVEHSSVVARTQLAPTSGAEEKNRPSQAARAWPKRTLRSSA
jgi:hypothetical protein